MQDVRKPLALIVGAAQRLLTDDGSLTISDWRREVQAILHHARALEASVMSTVPIPRDGTPRVLVVDPSDDNALMLVMALRYHGFEATSASDGPSALAAAATQKPDVAVISLRVGGDGGYALARQLRQLPRGARTRLIAVTDPQHDFDAEKAYAAGFEHRLESPVSIEALESAIRIRPLRDPFHR
jgi:CheY-like chemotaxis protein